eukprot:1149077-Pyramimonas_sp.AAC.1
MRADAIDRLAEEIEASCDYDAARCASAKRVELETAAADVTMRRMFNVLKPLYKPAQIAAASVR